MAYKIVKCPLCNRRRKTHSKWFFRCCGHAFSIDKCLESDNDFIWSKLKNAVQEDTEASQKFALTTFTKIGKNTMIKPKTEKDIITEEFLPEKSNETNINLEIEKE